MGFSTDDAIVRVERFKPGGKWYDTWAVDMREYYRMDAGKSEVTGETLPPVWLAVQTAILREIQRRIDNGMPDVQVHARERFKEWNWVCLEPYHFQAVPIMFVAQTMWRDHRACEERRAIIAAAVKGGF
jgi:hypothetical protein